MLRCKVPRLVSGAARLLAVLVLLLASGCATRAGPSPTPALAWVAQAGEALPEYDALFYRESGGWTGGDGILSVPLAPEITLWLYGDTSFGEIRDNKRRCPFCLANNSIALQRGKDSATARVEFFFGPPRDGKPTAFFAAPDGRGWLWPGHGLRAAQGLWLFFAQFERSDEPGLRWGKFVGAWLANVANPDESPASWRVTYSRIPWTRVAPESGNLVFGLAVLREGEEVYIYGIDEERTTSWNTRHLIVARVPEARLGDFDAWRFHAAGQWVDDWRAAGRAFVAAPEFSVTRQPSSGEFVAVYTESGLSAKILLRRAPTPTGPWGAAQTIYECPEAARDARNYCYAAKGHGGLSPAADELIVAYAAQGTDDARLYFPHFVRVRFAKR